MNILVRAAWMAVKPAGRAGSVPDPEPILAVLKIESADLPP